MSMNRLEYTQEHLSHIAQWRAEQLEGPDLGQDDDLTALVDMANGFPTDDPAQGIYLDRRDRPSVAYYQTPEGAWMPTPLKLDDDVLVHGYLFGRVVSPNRGRDKVLVYVVSDFGPHLEDVPVYAITDRAPADPNETPMPLIPPTPEEEAPT